MYLLRSLGKSLNGKRLFVLVQHLHVWVCCLHVQDPADEDKMIFCDLCDRGYHTYCCGLQEVSFSGYALAVFFLVFPRNSKIKKLMIS